MYRERYVCIHDRGFTTTTPNFNDKFYEKFRADYSSIEIIDMSIYFPNYELKIKHFCRIKL